MIFPIQINVSLVKYKTQINPILNVYQMNLKSSQYTSKTSKNLFIFRKLLSIILFVVGEKQNGGWAVRSDKKILSTWLVNGWQWLMAITWPGAVDWRLRVESSQVNESWWLLSGLLLNANITIYSNNRYHTHEFSRKESAGCVCQQKGTNATHSDSTDCTESESFDKRTKPTRLMQGTTLWPKWPSSTELVEILSDVTDWLIMSLSRTGTQAGTHARDARSIRVPVPVLLTSLYSMACCATSIGWPAKYFKQLTPLTISISLALVASIYVSLFVARYRRAIPKPIYTTVPIYRYRGLRYVNSTVLA